MTTPKYPGIRTTTDRNQLASHHTDARITEDGEYRAGAVFPVAAERMRGELAFGGVDVG